MSIFTEQIDKSVSNPHVLFEMNRTVHNDQWVNIGAGIWEVDFTASYPFVDDPDFLDGFTTVYAGGISQLKIDSAVASQQSSLVSLSSAAGPSWFYDSGSRILYVRFPDSDEPWAYDAEIYFIYGYSFSPVAPSGALTLYDARLRTIPDLRKARDPLYFSRLTFEGGRVELINTDGEFDNAGELADIYGNVARILYGFDGMAYSDYVVLFTGYVGEAVITEDSFTLDVRDKRKQLTKYLASYSCTAMNALDSIVDILTKGYTDIAYTSDYFDTTAWAAAKASAPNITMNWTTPKSVIALIEDVCVSVFGIFDTDINGKFTFRYVGGNHSYSGTIPKEDILSKHRIYYDPTEVISSVCIGYNRDWATVLDPYTRTYNDDYEAEVYEKYKTYNQQEFDTMLINLSDARSLAGTIISYTKDVHGTLDITVPMAYYGYEVGDDIYVEIHRDAQSMLGTKGCEILSKTYKLVGVPYIILGVRIN